MQYPKSPKLSYKHGTQILTPNSQIDYTRYLQELTAYQKYHQEKVDKLKWGRKSQEEHFS